VLIDGAGRRSGQYRFTIFIKHAHRRRKTWLSFGLVPAKANRGKIEPCRLALAERGGRPFSVGIAGGCRTHDAEGSRQHLVGAGEVLRGSPVTILDRDLQRIITGGLFRADLQPGESRYLVVAGRAIRFAVDRVLFVKDFTGGILDLHADAVADLAPLGLRTLHIERNNESVAGQKLVV